MKVTICVSLALAILPLCALGRQFSKCEMAQEMYAAGYAMEALPEWMCLINSESSFNSSAIGGPNTNGSSDWGLFQVNDNFWCTVEGVGNDCNISCWDLVDDYLADDFACIKLIYARHGFEAWRGWSYKCQDGLSAWEVDECF